MSFMSTQLSSSSMKSQKDLFESFNLPDASGNIPKQTIKQKIKENSNYIIYNRRWIVIAVFCLLNATNAFIMMSLPPISYEVMHLFSINNEQVNWCSNVFLFVSIPGGIIAGYALERYHLLNPLVIASILQALGATLRASSIYVYSGGYNMLLCGSILAACAEPILTWCPTRVSFNWFPTYERPIANSIASLSMPLGIMISLFLGPIVVDHNPLLVGTYLWLIAGTAILGSVIMCIGFFFIDALPPTPPSASAAIYLSESERSTVWVRMMVDLKDLARNRHYWFMNICVGTTLGVLHTFLIMSHQLLCPSGYSATFNSYLGVLVVALGIAGSSSLTTGIQKGSDPFIWFRTYYMLGLLFVVMAFVLVLLSLDTHTILLPCILSLYGFFSLPTYPIGNELSAEIVYPSSSTISAGLLYTTGGIIGSILSMVISLFSVPVPSVDLPDSKCAAEGISSIVDIDGVMTEVVFDYSTALWVTIGLIIPLGMVAIFVGGNLRRTDIDIGDENFVDSISDSCSDVLVSQKTKMFVLSPRQTCPNYKKLEGNNNWSSDGGADSATNSAMV